MVEFKGFEWRGTVSVINILNKHFMLLNHCFYAISDDSNHVHHYDDYFTEV